MFANIRKFSWINFGTYNVYSTELVNQMNIIYKWSGYKYIIEIRYYVYIMERLLKVITCSECMVCEEWAAFELSTS